MLLQPLTLPSRCCFVSVLLAFYVLAPRAHADLASELKPLIAAHAGNVSVAIKNLETGESFLHQETQVMPTASLIKFPVMIELYRQAELQNLK
jgi:beta-lactamase class A